MAKSGAAKSKRGPGRPKGSRNKITNEAKQAILMAFDEIGGWKRLAEWIKEDPENEKIYWTKLFPRLLPRPAAEPEPEKEALPPVRGALIWEPPTPPPYPPLSSAKAAELVEAAVAGGLELPSSEELAGRPPEVRAAGP